MTTPGSLFAPISYGARPWLLLIPVRRFSAICVLFALCLAASAAELRTATLNCFLLFAPENHKSTGMRREATSPAAFEEKILNLASLLTNTRQPVGLIAEGVPTLATPPLLDVIALEEIGGEREASRLGAALMPTKRGTNWKTCFLPGRDTYTGEEVALLVCVGSGVKVLRVSRDPSLEILSKHLVVDLDAYGNTISVLVVHMIRPIGASAKKHDGQLLAIRAWVSAKRSQGRDIVVLGDFNNDHHDLLRLPSANALLSWPATHSSGRGFDHIYSSLKFTNAAVGAPPYGRRPNDSARAAWTDHYLLSGVLALP